jgi:flavin reductase (DIM6/NTAB) family NADH-FMN oxidoreductase RutF
VRIVDPLHSSPAAASATSVDLRRQALERIPSSDFLLTAGLGDFRGGILARWIQQVSSGPPMVLVAIEKGQPLSPIIRDARFFGLCEPRADDRLLRKLFAESPDEARPDGDPFVGMPLLLTSHGVPIPRRAASWLECELVRHLDVEGSCELYVGLVHAAGVSEEPTSPVAKPTPGRADSSPPKRVPGPAGRPQPHRR